MNNFTNSDPYMNKVEELEKKLDIVYDFADLCIEEMFYNSTYENRLQLQEQLQNLRTN